ncbi:ABC transporter ATP-binding protein [uncultured Formosa sp.]|uniref:ABC transporter ATP-binding protein n=1 Tax=uncultured Formosa sp. TaxID=255435 RepID=UPI002621CFD4|nr:ABC transporter ATP-binding protein [uncultured Formosa sp.]
MKPAIKIENLSKQYRLGTVGTGSFAHDVNRWWHTVRGKEDPYLKIGESNDRSTKGNSEYVWALQDINFEVQPGEVLGIIGKNGAGKSTLLKLLSRVTAPTTGSIKARGRIASLLEVGTGFHPELTGRENVFLNGAIMGMTKKEISSKFDEIVDFAGCERYIDTPVKRYSSGMYVRLAFAVAAHLEPEILIVDEVLAVGDAEFQKKAIGKMKSVSSEGGRTVLFVSHNMASVKNLCTKGVLMENGTVKLTGDIDTVVESYIKGNAANTENTEYVAKDLELTDFQTLRIKKAYSTSLGVKNSNVFAGDAFDINVEYISNELDRNCRLFIGVYNQSDQKLLHLGNVYGGIDTFKSKNEGKIVCSIPKCNLKDGAYTINLSFHVDGFPADRVKNAFTLNVENGDFYGTGKLPDGRENVFYIEQNWQIS